MCSCAHNVELGMVMGDVAVKGVERTIELARTTLL